MKFLWGVKISILLCVMGMAPAFSSSVDAKSIPQHDTLAIDALYDSAYNLLEVDNLRALGYASRGFRLARLASDSLRIVHLGMAYGSALRRLNRLDSAVLVYDVAIPLARRIQAHRELGILLLAQGISYTLKGKYDRALVSLFQALEVREALGDSIGLWTVKSNIGLAFYKLENYRKALNIFLALLRNQPSGADRGKLDILYLNAAHCYVYLDNIDSARFYLTKGTQACGVNCSGDIQMTAYYVSALLALREGGQIHAEDLFERSLKLAESGGDSRFVLDNIDQLSGIYLREGRLGEVRTLLAKAEAVMTGNYSFDLERLKIYRRFAEYHRRSANFEVAIIYLDRYIGLRDSIFSAELRRNLAETEAAFAERENRLRIESQEQVIALNNSLVRKGRFINVALGLLLALSGVCIFLLYANFKHRARINRILGKRLEERTNELGQGRLRYLTLSLERDAVIARASEELEEISKTLEGLGRAGRSEFSDPRVNAYFERLEELSSRLTKILQRRLRPDRSSTAKT